MSIGRLLDRMRAGDLTAAANVRASLERVAAVDRNGPRLNSVAALSDTAEAEAEALDRRFVATGHLAGPLHGIPVVVKDCIETAGLPMAFGSSLLTGYRPAADATVVRRLREAGAIILGTSTMPDLATSLFARSSHTGVTRNPHDPERDPGGSSSGSAAAVAGGIAVAGLGTDNGGSIRIPASFCGLVGVRSTPGRISRAGSQPLVPRQDTVGPITASVADALAIFRVLEGPDEADPLSLQFGPEGAGGLAGVEAAVRTSGSLRVGVLRQAFGPATDARAADVNGVMNVALHDMADLGVEVEDPVSVDGLESLVAAASMFLLCTRAALNAFFAERPGLAFASFDALAACPDLPADLDVIRLMAAGPVDPASAPAYHVARTAREDLETALRTAMARARVDALVYPSAQIAAPTHREVDERLVTTFTFPSNALISSHSWMPAMTVPVGPGTEGLPVGCEILTRRGDERSLFEVAFALEAATAARHLAEPARPGAPRVDAHPTP